MSAVSSFVIECARAGRWVRGLMALQDQHLSTEPPIRLACVALAQAAAPHSWAAALSLLHPTDALRHPQEVCKTVDTIARHAELHVDILERSIEAYLLALQAPRQSEGYPASGLPRKRGSIVLYQASELSTSSTSIQRQVFLSATRWCGWETAARLLKCLPTPPPRTCVERVQALRILRHCILHDVGPFHYWESRTALPSSDDAAAGPLAASTRGTSLAEQLARMEPSVVRRYSARDLRELSRLRDQKRQQLLLRTREEEDTLIRQAMVDVSPSVLSVCVALRTMTRLTSASYSTAVPKVHSRHVLTLVNASRLTPDLALLYGRAAGLCIPHSWRATVDKLNRAEVRDAHLHRQLTMWVISRGDWSAALERFSQLYHNVCGSAPQRSDTRGSDSRREGEEAAALDCVLRTAAPASYVLRAVPQASRPWYRLVSSCHTNVSLARQIAGALAAGVRLDEIQLSEVGKEWAAHGRWEEALALYYRFPLPEFQRCATRSLVNARPALPSALSASRPLTSSIQKGSDRLAPGSSSKDSAAFCVLAVLELLVPQHGVRYDCASPPRPAPPLGTFPASLLIETAANWSQAVAVFRACLKRGTRCKPQMLSTLMRHQDLPSQELRQILRSYPAAVNEGVRRRAKDSFGIE